MTASDTDVLVQLPPDSLPYDAADVERLRIQLETWVKDTLEPVGVGRVTIDLASELTAVAEVGDPDEAVTRLADGLDASGLPDGAVIAVRQEPSITVRWPPERSGEQLMW